MARVFRPKLASRLMPYPAYRFLTRAYHGAVRDARFYDDGRRLDFFGHAFRALTFNGIDGDYCEFGCYTCQTFHSAYIMAKAFRHTARMWAFDSFCGLPAPSVPEDEHPRWFEGNMAIGVEEFNFWARRQGIPRDAYTTVPGFFKDSLAPAAPNADSLPRNIAMAYIDCDLYSSTMDVLNWLLPRFKHGMILVFDDYYCYSSTQDAGERIAFLEVAQQHPEWSFVPFLNLPFGGQSFIVLDSTRTRPVPLGVGR